MAIELDDGTIVRSLPEQVSYNDERIEDQGTRLTTLEAQVAAALVGVFHYKGSVATYGDLPATDNEVGDVYNVLDTGKNYAWSGIFWDDLGGIVDLSNLVTLDTQQTITGEKTFTNYLNIGTAGWNLYADQAMGHDVLHIDSGGGSTFIIEATATTVDCDFIPSINDSYKLGNTSYKWKDIYLSGNLSDGTNSATVANISNGIFNVINASDIVSNTLTQAQYDLITNGKPTLIKGSFSNTYDTIIFQTHNDGAFIRFDCIGISQYNETKIRVGYINNATKQIVYVTGGILITYSGSVDISNFKNLNGKAIPAYPSNTGTFTLKCVNGVLIWIED